MKSAVAILLLSLGGALSAPAALIAHYPLDFINGGTTTPDSTGGTGGTLVGAGITLDTGQLGNSFNFSGGTGQYVGIPDAAFGRTAFTASVWFNPTTVGNGDPLANWTNAAPSPRSFLIRTGSVLETFLRSGGSQIGGASAFPTQAVTAGVWNHALITYDGQTLRTYLNGEASANTASFASPTAIGEGIAGTAAIGGRGGSEGSMVGRVDDVAFWDEQLSADEIVGLFDVSGLGYNASDFDLLKMVHDAGSGAVTINGLTWMYQSGLSGGAGLQGGGGILVLDPGAGTGLAIPEPSRAILLALGGLAFLRRRR